MKEKKKKKERVKLSQKLREGNKKQEEESLQPGGRSQRKRSWIKSKEKGSRLSNVLNARGEDVKEMLAANIGSSYRHSHPVRYPREKGHDFRSYTLNRARLTIWETRL